MMQFVSVRESVVFWRIFHPGISEVETLSGTSWSRAQAVFAKDQEALGTFCVLSPVHFSYIF